MRTRTRTDSTAGQRLDFSWDNDAVQEDTPQKQADAANPTDESPALPFSNLPSDAAEAPEAPSAEQQSSEQPSAEMPHEASSVEPLPTAEPNDEDKNDAADAEKPQHIERENVTPNEPAEPQENAPKPPKNFKSKAARGTQNTSIVNDGASLGTRLKEYRENANVSIEDLSRRLFVQPSVIQDLENGDYQSLSRSFKDNNSIYLVATLKDICSELGVSKNQTDDMVDLYYSEIATTGLPLYDSKASQIPDKTESADNDNGFNIGEKEPIIKKLPKILIFLLIVSFVVFILISVVIPYIGNSRKQPERKIDFAPLIKPEKVPPIKLNVP